MRERQAYTISLMLHGLAFAGAGYALDALPSPYAVQRGRASIDLVASVSHEQMSDAECHEVKIVDVARPQPTEFEPAIDPPRKQATPSTENRMPSTPPLAHVETPEPVLMESFHREDRDTIVPTAKSPSIERAQKPPPASVASVASQADSGAEVEAPRSLVTNPQPRYPSAAAGRAHGDVVKILLTINEQGTVDGAEVSLSSGLAVLDQAVLETLRQWRFHPATRFGTPVRYSQVFPVRFNFRTQ